MAAVVAVVVAVEAEEEVVEEAEVAVVEEAEVAAGVAVAVEVVVQSKPWSNHTGTLVRKKRRVLRAACICACMHACVVYVLVH